MNIFWGVITKLDFFFFFFFFFFLGGGGVLYILGLFKVKIQNGNIFWAAKFQIFLDMPDIPDFLLFFFGAAKFQIFLDMPDIPDFLSFFLGGGGGAGGNL